MQPITPGALLSHVLANTPALKEAGLLSTPLTGAGYDRGADPRRLDFNTPAGISLGELTLLIYSCPSLTPCMSFRQRHDADVDVRATLVYSSQAYRRMHTQDAKKCDADAAGALQALSQDFLSSGAGAGNSPAIVPDSTADAVAAEIAQAAGMEVDLPADEVRPL